MTTVISNITVLVNFCLKNSEGWGNEAGNSLDLESSEGKKRPANCLCFLYNGASFPSPVCVPGDLHGWHGACGEGGCWLGQGWLPCSWLLIWSEFTLPGNQAGRQEAHPGRGLSVRLFFLNSPPRHTILRSHFFLPQEAQENTIASSLTAKLNPGLLYPARFEKLDITPKSAQKIKPVLERWMAEAEARHRAGMQNLTEFIGSEPSKKRKRRTSFTPQALEILNAHFEKNTHPSGQEMTEIAEKLNYDREVVRVWFCNKRQALKNTIKRLKQHEPTSAAPLEPLADSPEENC